MFVDFSLFFFSFGAAGETTISWILELLFHSLNVGFALDQLAAVGMPSMKWIEHTLSLFPGSQAVLSLFSVF